MTLHITALLISIVFWTSSLLGTCQLNTVSSISLSIENLQSGQGDLHIAIYDEEEKFTKSKEPYLLKIHKVAATGRLQLQLDSIPHGRYALAIYHDVNSNGDLDKNIFGIPKEPYGFSNNPPAKWSAPKYKETSFMLEEEGVKLVVSVKKWKER